MILSVSRRTDIPSFYSNWFMERVNAGFVCARNPMNHGQISRINLCTEVVDCIVFWTKDAKNIMPHLSTIDNLGYKYYFQFTLTPYDNSIERNLRNKLEIEDTFIELSKCIGKDRIIWRYDPIVLNDTINVIYHKQQFERMCRKLAAYTNTVTISFVDMYSKLKTDKIRTITDEEIAELSEFIGSVAKSYGLSTKACCEKTDLSIYGIKRASCIDKETIEKICAAKLNISHDKNQRDMCGCFQSIDIGAYNTCKNGCIYCYANYSDISVNTNCEKHLLNSELLIGTIADYEKVTNRNVESDITSQLKLF